jgi:hypothetical protein
VRNPRRIFEVYMSPGSFAEKLTFFAARAAGSKGEGGGKGEANEILEPTLDEALAMIDNGEIISAKAILLLHYAELWRTRRSHARW